jgi:hypothetical protein
VWRALAAIPTAFTSILTGFSVSYAGGQAD